MSKPRPIPASAPGAPLRINASLPLMVRLEELMSFDRAVHDPSNVEELHEMRIAVKRLRYTLEIFSSAVPGSDRFLKTLKQLQDLLGAIHDADVLAPVLEGEWTGSDEDPCPATRALHEHVGANRVCLYHEFVRTWDAALQDGFAGRLWYAALSASAPPDPDAPPEPGASGALPPKRTRRIHRAIALLRLAPHAAAAAMPDRVSRLDRAVEQVHDAMFDRDAEDMDDREWWKVVKRLGRIISYEES